MKLHITLRVGSDCMARTPKKAAAGWPRLPEGGLANNRAVWTIIAQSPRPVTAYEILNRLNAMSKVAPTTVYRALNRLLAAGVIHRLGTRNAFTPCTHAHRAGEANLLVVCNTCGRAEEFPAPGVLSALTQAAEDTPFDINPAIVEVPGVCRGCS
jgi:Fur family zinc uptake transcriptional regulator